jgi:predicted secreted protein
MTSAKSNYGTLLKVGDGQEVETFASIGEVVNIDPPELINEAVEATNHGSGGWKEFVSGGLKELTEFTTTVNFVDAAVTALYNDLVAGTEKNYQIVFPDDGSTTWTFAALVVGIKPMSVDAASPEALQAEIKFRPTGANVLA